MQCKAYVEDIAAKVSPAALEAAGARLLVVSCGSWEPIAGYRGTSLPRSCHLESSAALKTRTLKLTDDFP